MRENQGWQQEGLSHEQAVKGFQAYIKRFQQLDLELQSHLPPEKRKQLPAEAIVRQKLDWESGSVEPDKGDFYSTLRYAWDAVAYDRYKPGSHAESLAGSTLSMYYNHNRAVEAPRPEVITLADPVQVRMMDALADAAGVPHQHGRAEVAIPEKLRNYTRWVLSQEYQDKVKAEAARARGETSQEPPQQQPSAEIHHVSANDNSKESSAGNRHTKQNENHSAFWDGLIEQSSVVPSREDPAFWPRRVFEKFEFLIANRDYQTDKAQHELATSLAPIQDSIRRVRTAYEIAAYSSIKKLPWEKGESSWQEMVKDDLRQDREMNGRESVELTDPEQAIVRKLCETPRYAVGRDGKRTLQAKIPFDPDRRIYRYADILGPLPKTPPQSPTLS